ncbi:MAG: dihydroorotate dehydrogenase electron transfer subunit [Aquificae bacterium]|nr:dihydroorotate dehydrogenase electron transfer subunit [Aquificota bacterium]
MNPSELLAPVLENEHISGRLHRLVVRVPDPIVRSVKPGHFAMVKPSDTYDPMGRRAFAVADTDEHRLVFYYDVVGRGTALLSRKKPGESLPLLVPLGEGLFSYEGEKHLLIGGGVGLAGLTLLAKRLRELGKKVFIAYGARTKEELGMVEWLEREGFPYVLYTDDGSAGRRGRVTDVLSDFGKDWTVHACGPKPMLKALKREAKGRRVYVSLEERMACGWGVCLGCVVKSAGGHFRRVCVEGPVMRLEEVVL